MSALGALGLPLVHAGKVRELYDADDGLLVMVASDRISAFDVVFNEPIADKGRVLTAMTAYWCEELADLAPPSLVSADPSEIARRVPAAAGLEEVAGRVMLVRRAEMLHLECIVRGYLAGSAWREYQAQGTVNGAALAPGLRLADRLAEPLFTPSTKAEEGHDVNIDFAAAVDLVGTEAALAAKTMSLALYRRAAERVAAAGFILADTKFELGYVDGVLSLCDEVVTPDSSRLWPAELVVPGTTPPAFDKQPLRDWSEAQDWDKRPPPPGPPPRGRGGHLGALRGRLRTGHRALPGRLVRCAEMRFVARVEVSLRPGIADPEGATIERALPALGFDGVHDVRAGRSFRFSVEADDEAAARARAEELAHRLLANPVIEQSHLELAAGAGD